MPNILLIDDSGVIRSSLKSILERNGFTAFEATSLNDLKYNSFSKTVKLSEINLILLDYYLENETGLEIIKYIKLKNYAIPIVMITGEAKRDIVINSIKQGATDYILKPFDDETLIKKVNSNIRVLSFFMTKDDYRLELDNFKSNLILEIERSIRAKNILSVSKIILPGDEIVIKDLIKRVIRDIDQVYLIDKNTAAVIFPFTDDVGFNIIKDKIKNIIGLRMKDSNLPTKHTVFKGNEKTINDVESKEKYYKDIFSELGIIEYVKN